MKESMSIAESSFVITVDQLRQLFDAVKEQGYEMIGPMVKDGVIQLTTLNSFDELPVGYRDYHEAGTYRLQKTEDGSFFKYTVAPQSIKNFLYPPEQRLFRVERKEDDFKVIPESEAPKKHAFFAIRSCDQKAIEVLDKVFLNKTNNDINYFNRRSESFIITATCLEPSSVCFCTSMGHGPKASGGDIHLTEINQDEDPYFVVEIGSERGKDLIAKLSLPEAQQDQKQEALQVVETSLAKISKTLQHEDLASHLDTILKHEHWKDVADRCLSCANCTMVCPTCFCSTVEDRSDLSGDHSERWLLWDSCFTSDHSYVHGGSLRPSRASRYRQWLTHKLITWKEQFGQSGCVGCGRCISWCPVGIDLTEEVRALQNEL